MKYNSLGLKFFKNVELVEDTIDEIFRNTFDEDKIVHVTDVHGNFSEFILHDGEIYEETNRSESGNLIYMSLIPLIKKVIIINGILRGDEIEYVDNKLFDNEAIKKLEALSTLEFDELTAIERNREGYLDTLSMTFRKTSKNREYQYCDIEFGYNEEIYKYIENFNYNGLGIICTKELINAKRDVNIIYQNAMEGL